MHGPSEAHRWAHVGRCTTQSPLQRARGVKKVVYRVEDEDVGIQEDDPLELEKVEGVELVHR